MPCRAQNVVFGSLLEGGVVGTLTAAACWRWASRPVPWFVGLATIGTIASFAMPVASDAGAATAVVLSLLHVVAAVIIVPPLAAHLATGDEAGGRAGRWER